MFLEESSVFELRNDPDFKPIVETHFLEGAPIPSEERKSANESSTRLDPPDNLSCIDGHPEKLWQNDTQMYNPESAIVVFDCNLAKKPQLTDMIICMGGDGTLLHVASIFQAIFYFPFFHKPSFC